MGAAVHEFARSQPDRELPGPLVQAHFSTVTGHLRTIDEFPRNHERLKRLLYFFDDHISSRPSMQNVRRWTGA
jgi:hypothetical protein